jgi:hypothetical protein
MNPDERNFFKQLLHQLLHAGLFRVVAGMPWFVALLLVLGCIAAIVYFGLY